MRQKHRIRRRLMPFAALALVLALALTTAAVPAAMAKYAARGEGGARARVAAWDPKLGNGDEITELSTDRKKPTRIFVSRLEDTNFCTDFNVPAAWFTGFDNQGSEVNTRYRLWAEYPAEWEMPGDLLNPSLPITIHRKSARVDELYSPGLSLGAGEAALDAEQQQAGFVKRDMLFMEGKWTFLNQTNIHHDYATWYNGGSQDGPVADCKHLTHIMKWRSVYNDIPNLSGGSVVYNSNSYSSGNNYQNPHNSTASRGADIGPYDANRIGSSYWFDFDLVWDMSQID
ncbi:MAG: hypothetical protein FWH26_05905 [Oscillospiraceae bacterium]|nr:hypothetical protein [Oscillospiraceae bacterium]